MQNFIKVFLQKKGYSCNTQALEIIGEADDWYCNNIDDKFHQRETLQGTPTVVYPLGLGKRVCSDEANLCEVVEITTEDKGVTEFIEYVLTDNSFMNMYREQLEQTAGLGTVGAYIRLDNADLYEDGTVKGGELKINYVNATGIIPLTVINKEIIECGFIGENLVNGKKQTTLVIFILNNGLYKADSYKFNDVGEQIDYKTIQLGDTKPFAIMRNAEVNNIENMQGYGLPKLYGAIPYLKGCDIAYNVIFGDLDKAEKIVLINEYLCTFDANGQPITPSDQMKSRFVSIGEKLPEQESLMVEINPTIRIEEITKSMELLLSMLSMSFGFGNKKYTFANGQIQTATQYIGERQDAMQELNKQRGQAKEYIQDICKALMWFSNQFKGTSYNTDIEVMIDFDDSYIEDKVSKLESMRADALAFPEIPKLLEWYIQEKYNLTEDEAKALLSGEEQLEDNETAPTITDAEVAMEQVAGKSLNGAQTPSLITVITQYKSGKLTLQQAINIISVAVGITREEAQDLIGEV